MTPFHFGNGRRRLFGIYEPALCKSVKERAVLLCHPEGNEQVFAYRTMRQLAARLAGAGFHVLRFDYFGTGDSYGETGEGNIASWCEDIDTAMNELRDITAAAQVSLVGLRLGANLAARAAAKRPGETGKLILWDPLPAGEVASHFTRSNGAIQAEETRAACVASNAALPGNTLLVLTARAPAPEESASLDILYRPDVPVWIEERVTSGTVPVDTLQCILDWLK